MIKKLLVFILVIGLVASLFIMPVYAARDPYVTIQASSFDESISLHSRSNFSANTRQVSAIWKGDYLGYKGFDFGENGPTAVTVTSGAREGYAQFVEIRIDKPDGELIASVPITPINFQTGVANTVDIKAKVKGVHDIYITYDDKTADIFNFQFYTEEPDKFEYKEFSLNSSFEKFGNDYIGHAANILCQLGMIDNEIDLDLNMPVTRAEFADAVYGMYVNREIEDKTDATKGAKTDEEKGAETPFVDVHKDNVYSEAIAYLTSQGVINGVSDTEFKPDEYIRYGEAVTIIVRMLGFSELAEIKGGYPKGYLMMASNQKLISSGVDTSDFLSYETMIELLYKTLDADYLEVTGITLPDDFQYEYRSNVLERTRDVYNDVGTVEASEISSLVMQRSAAGRNTVIIDGIKYKIGETSAIGLLGVECEFYYHLTDNDEKVLVAIAPDLGTDIVEILSYNDEIINISNTKICYIPAGTTREKTIDIDRRANVIYNGVAADSAITSLVNTSSFKGRIIVVENHNSAQTVIIDEYIDYIIESIDYKNDTIVGKDNVGSIVGLEDALLVIFDDVGKEVLLKKLSQGDLITVYESKNKSGTKFIRMYIGKETVNGNVDTIGDDYYYIDGTKYVLSNNCKNKITLGETATFLLNVYGEIVGIGDFDSGSLNVGLFMAIGSEPKGLKSDLKIKIMTTEGKAEIFTVAEKLTVDGVKLNSYSEIANGKSTWCGFNSIDTETAIRYRLNRAGEVNLIDTPETNDGSYVNRITCLTPEVGTFKYERRSGFVIGGSGTGQTYYMPSESIVFNFIGAENRDENCTVDTAYNTIVQNGFQPWGKLYSTTGKEKYEADLFVWKNSLDSNGSGSPFVVQDLGYKLNEEGDVTRYIRGWIDGGIEELFVHDEALALLNVSGLTTESTDFETGKSNMTKLLDNVRTGDVLRIRRNPSNTLRAATLWLLYDGASSLSIGGEETMTPALHTDAPITGSYSNVDTRTIYGTVIDKTDDYMVVSYKSESQEYEDVIPINFGSIAMVSVNARGERVVNSGLSPLNITADNNKVFVVFDEGQPVSIVIFDKSIN